MTVLAMTPRNQADFRGCTILEHARLKNTGTDQATKSLKPLSNESLKIKEMNFLVEVYEWKASFPITGEARVRHSSIRDF